MLNLLFRAPSQIVRRKNNPRLFTDTTTERQLHAAQLIHRADLFGDAMLLFAAAEARHATFAIRW